MRWSVGQELEPLLADLGIDVRQWAPVALALEDVYGLFDSHPTLSRLLSLSFISLCVLAD
jgi:hypothetical protein